MCMRIWNILHVYHNPSSCMVIRVHVVKGRQYICSAHIRWPIRGDGVWDRLSTLKATNLDASITEMNLTAQLLYSFQNSDRWDRWVVDGVLYIAHASYRDYISQEVQPAILVKESSTQLIRYSLDTCVRYSTYLLIFKSQKGSIEALHFLVIT
jgi:hypothetical protein